MALAMALRLQVTVATTTTSCYYEYQLLLQVLVIYMKQGVYAWPCDLATAVAVGKALLLQLQVATTSTSNTNERRAYTHLLFSTIGKDSISRPVAHASNAIPNASCSPSWVGSCTGGACCAGLGNLFALIDVVFVNPTRASTRTQEMCPLA